jgi:hypothetical protein
MVKGSLQSIVLILIVFAVLLPLGNLTLMVEGSLLPADGLLEEGLLDELLEVLLLLHQEETRLLFLHVDHRAEVLAEEPSGMQLLSQSGKSYA